MLRPFEKGIAVFSRFKFFFHFISKLLHNYRKFKVLISKTISYQKTLNSIYTQR